MGPEHTTGRMIKPLGVSVQISGNQSANDLSVNKQERGMSAYVIANYDITDEEGYQSYVGAVGPTVFSHGGEILVAGPGSEIVEGSPGAVSVVLKFPSMEALRGWYDSSEYQNIITRRTDNTEGSVIFANEFVMPE